jgi:hypothetical protein
MASEFRDCAQAHGPCACTRCVKSPVIGSMRPRAYAREKVSLSERRQAFDVISPPTTKRDRVTASIIRELPVTSWRYICFRSLYRINTSGGGEADSRFTTQNLDCFHSEA